MIRENINFLINYANKRNPQCIDSSYKFTIESQLSKAISEIKSDLTILDNKLLIFPHGYFFGDEIYEFAKVVDHYICVQKLDFSDNYFAWSDVTTLEKLCDYNFQNLKQISLSLSYNPLQLSEFIEKCKNFSITYKDDLIFELKKK